MFTSIMVVIAPFVVNFITQLIKNLPTFESLRVSRKPVIRFLAALVSFVYVLLTMWIDPGSIADGVVITSVTALGLTFFAWLSALGSYAVFFKRD